MIREERDTKWYPLDNAARLFPSIASPAFPTVFRLSATLHRPVSLSVARRVAVDLARRFPHFRVVLRRGVFWYYLEERGGPFPVEADLDPPCSREPTVRRHPELLRILVRGHRIAVEVSHILTDGGGVKEFFRTLLFEYLVEREGLDRQELLPEARELGILSWDVDPVDGIDEGEQQYAFRDYYSPRLPKPVRTSSAWHVPGVRLPHHRYHVTTLLYELSRIKEAARNHGAGVTEYLIAAFLFALQEYQGSLPNENGRRNFRPLRILVPVDLRPVEHSRTLRNFFVFVLTEVDVRLGRYEFTEIIKKIRHQMGSEIDPRNLRRFVTRNVRPERNALIRIIPVVLKDTILRFVHRNQGERINTASFSNLMAVRFPDAVQSSIEHVDFVPPASPVTGINATLVSSGTTVSLTFGSRLRTHEVERRVVETLRGEGISGRLITNWGWE